MDETEQETAVGGEVTSMEDLDTLIENGGQFPESTEEESTEASYEEPADETAEEYSGEVEEDLPQEGAEEEYVPNYSYNVMGNERQFDDRLSYLLQGKEEEDLLRELYTKADGLDAYKARYTDLEGKVKEYEDTISKQANDVQVAVDFFQGLQENVKGKNFDRVLKDLNISADDILDYAYGVAQERQQPIEIQKELARQRQMEEENQMLRRQQAMYEQEAQARQQQLEYQQAQEEQANAQAAVQAEIQGYMDELDAALDSYQDLQSLGIDLKSLVINEGMKRREAMAQRGMDYDPPVEQLVSDVLDGFRANIVRDEPAPEVIPTVRASSSAPVATHVTSMADIDKMIASREYSF